MSKIKPGDWVMAEVLKVSSDTSLTYLKDGSGYAAIYTKAVKPTPAPDPHAELKNAVVEASIVSRKPGGNKHIQLQEWEDATDALIAAQTPPDPVKELRAAWSELNGEVFHGTRRNRLEAAIAAIEAIQSK